VSAWLAAEHPAVRVTGVDVDPGQIDLARRVHGETGQVSFVVGDATDLPMDDASVDLVVAHHVFHHLPDWKDAVGETARVLRPGGAVLWLDLVVPAIVRDVLRPFARKSGLFTLAEVEAAFASRGLRSAACRAVRTGPLVHHDLVLRRTLGAPLERAAYSSTASKFGNISAISATLSSVPYVHAASKRFQSWPTRGFPCACRIASSDFHSKTST
jgi:SAM-dependent methyltransferase